MHSALVHTHSLLRYFVLILLLLVIAKAWMGMNGKKPFGKADNMLSLTLFSVTHTQLLIGLILYFFASPLVHFSGAAMKDPIIRYWTTEHSVLMIAAVTLITIARISIKKMADDTAKHKRLFWFNTIALLLILLAIWMSKRGFFSIPGATA
ncbi:MAG TPA: hypothetical protein PLX35_04635 [Cyclobacteriaceae bacterium]|nr:hypothetical protein [Cyclobacteriaceae bacterium]